MKKSSLAIIGILAVVLLVIGFVAMSGDKSADKNRDQNSTSNMENMDMPTSTAPAEQADQTRTAMPEAQSDVRVNISEFAFAPQKITVKKGGKVTWTNMDTTRHDVKPDSPDGDFKASELLAKGESHTVTFNTIGTYNYICSPHPFMKGTVEVVE